MKHECCDDAAVLLSNYPNGSWKLEMDAWQCTIAFCPWCGRELNARSLEINEIIQAGNVLIERLNYWLQGDGDLCQFDGADCWNKDSGTIDADDIENPAHCTVCGATCGCSRCTDLEAIGRWCEVTRNTK